MILLTSAQRRDGSGFGSCGSLLVTRRLSSTSPARPLDISSAAEVYADAVNHPQPAHLPPSRYLSLLSKSHFSLLINTASYLSLLLYLSTPAVTNSITITASLTSTSFRNPTLFAATTLRPESTYSTIEHIASHTSHPTPRNNTDDLRNAPPSDPRTARPAPTPPRLSSHNLRLSTTTASPPSSSCSCPTPASQLSCPR